MGKIIDLTGMRFGRLTVIKRVLNHQSPCGKSSPKWECLCDCGNIKEVLGSNLRNSTTLSCGCLHKEVAGKLGKSSLGQAKTFRLPTGIAMRNRCFRAYQANAKKRGISFELDIAQFEKLTKENCFYCNCEPNSRQKAKWDTGDYIYNGIDRIDSSKGYVMDNVVPCCGTCNKNKMDMLQEDFLAWVERVYNHSIKDKK